MAAFTQMFTAYHDRLCRYAESYLGSQDAAQDVVSDVFLWIWEHREEWGVSGSLASYLYGAVRHRSMDRLKHHRRASRAHVAVALLQYSPGMAERTPTPEEDLHAKELARIVQRTLDRLPERAREAFRLQRQHGLAYAEIAEVMGISVSTVEKHMIRALADLRDGLSRWSRSD